MWIKYKKNHEKIAAPLPYTYLSIFTLPPKHLRASLCLVPFFLAAFIFHFNIVKFIAPIAFHHPPRVINVNVTPPPLRVTANPRPSRQSTT